LAAAVVGFLVFTYTGQNLSNPQPQQNSETNNTAKNSFGPISSGTTEEGDTAIELTPHEIESGRLSVDFSSNTHSVDLSDVNLKQAITLNFNGKEIKPITAPTLKGHHNSGTLVFPVDANLNTFSITITGIPKIQERIFEWNK